MIGYYIDFRALELDRGWYMFRLLRRRKESKIEAIWFRSDRSLMEIADAIGLSNASHDRENYWEWVVGSLSGHRIEITRTHKEPPEEVDTRLFSLDEKVIDDKLKGRLIERLNPVVSSSIKCGRWVYLKGNDFDKIVFEEFRPTS